ncbi:hypothetical protein OFC17_34775, partial [Escherichia coli]|nr:hypothetical protein [Escherichia coli]
KIVVDLIDFVLEVARFGSEIFSLQRAKFFLQCDKTPCFACLSPERIGLFFHLGDYIRDAVKVSFRRFKPRFGRTLPRTEF